MTSAENCRYIDSTSVIGAPLRMLQGCTWSAHAMTETAPTLPAKLYLGPHACIGTGVVLGEGVIVDAFCSIEPRTTIGARTVVIYRATVGGDSKIGEDCVIGGFVGEHSLVGHRCRVMGSLIHSHTDPSMSWDHHDQPEAAPQLEDDVFVGIQALVIGGVTLHKRSYVCAGAVLTRDLPSYHIAYAHNKIIHFSQWRGRLRDSPHFRMVDG